MSPQSQLIAGSLPHDDSMTRISTQESSVETSESGSATSYMHSRGRTTFAYNKPYGRERSEAYGESLTSMCMKILWVLLNG